MASVLLLPLLIGVLVLLSQLSASPVFRDPSPVDRDAQRLDAELHFLLGGTSRH